MYHDLEERKPRDGLLNWLVRIWKLLWICWLIYFRLKHNSTCICHAPNITKLLPRVIIRPTLLLLLLLLSKPKTMADSGNIIKKIARTMSYRDNSQDDPEYAPLQDEKSIFEQRGEHANARKKRNVLRTISYGLVLVSLVISVALNATAWRKLVELKRTSLSDENGHEHQHTTYGSDNHGSSLPQTSKLITCISRFSN